MQVINFGKQSQGTEISVWEEWNWEVGKASLWVILMLLTQWATGLHLGLGPSEGELQFCPPKCQRGLFVH